MSDDFASFLQGLLEDCGRDDCPVHGDAGDDSALITDAESLSGDTMLHLVKASAAAAHNGLIIAETKGLSRATAIKIQLLQRQSEIWAGAWDRNSVDQSRRAMEDAIAESEREHEAKLGLATTERLLEELEVRLRDDEHSQQAVVTVRGMLDNEQLQYRTVD